MNSIIVFDTETTGIPNWKIQSGDESQPHIVQLAALQVDLESRKVIQSIDLIVKPDGWEIPQETIDIHGITNEHAMEVGIPEEAVLNIFLNLWNGRKRVAYNTTFDNRIIRIATKRYKNEQVITNWKEGDYECAMIASKKAMGVKSVKLVDAYKYFTGKELKDAHSAMSDSKACMELYFEINNKESVVA
jgi:DNA polymerase-3 subunit epsilon